MLSQASDSIAKVEAGIAAGKTSSPQDMEQLRVALAAARSQAGFPDLEAAYDDVTKRLGD